MLKYSITGADPTIGPVVNIRAQVNSDAREAFAKLLGGRCLTTGEFTAEDGTRVVRFMVCGREFCCYTVSP